MTLLAGKKKQPPCKPMQDKRVTVPTWSHQLIVSVLSLDCSLTSARTGRAFCFLHHSCVHLIWSELMVLKSSGVQFLALVPLLCAHSSGSCLALLSETRRASSHPACFFPEDNNRRQALLYSICCDKRF